jgi:hypothetical protein
MRVVSLTEASVAGKGAGVPNKMKLFFAAEKGGDAWRNYHQNLIDFLRPVHPMIFP